VCISSTYRNNFGPRPWNRTTYCRLIRTVRKPESMPWMEPGAELEAASLIYRISASPSMLTGQT